MILEHKCCLTCGRKHSPVDWMMLAYLREEIYPAEEVGERDMRLEWRKCTCGNALQVDLENSCNILFRVLSDAMRGVDEEITGAAKGAGRPSDGSAVGRGGEQSGLRKSMGVARHTNDARGGRDSRGDKGFVAFLRQIATPDLTQGVGFDDLGLSLPGGIRRGPHPPK